MATDQQYADYVMEQLRLVPGASYRRMFGEYAVYASGKVVALLCDNQFFLRPNDAARAILGTPTEGAPFPGAKPHFVMEGELEDVSLMARLVAVTADAMPVPKSKSKTKAKNKAAPKKKTPAALRPASGEKRRKK